MHPRRVEPLQAVPDPPVPALARLDVLADEVIRLAREMHEAVAELRREDTRERGSDEQQH